MCEQIRERKHEHLAAAFVVPRIHEWVAVSAPDAVNLLVGELYTARVENAAFVENSLVANKATGVSDNKVADLLLQATTQNDPAVVSHLCALFAHPEQYRVSLQRGRARNRFVLAKVISDLGLPLTVRDWKYWTCVLPRSVEEWDLSKGGHLTTSFRLLTYYISDELPPGDRALANSLLHAIGGIGPQDVLLDLQLVDPADIDSGVWARWEAFLDTVREVGDIHAHARAHSTHTHERSTS
jgi:hypothetical protein